MNLEQFQESYFAAPKHSPECTICGSNKFEPLFQGDRHDLGLPIAQCQFCGLVSVVPRPIPEWFTEMYQNFYWPLYIGHRFKDEDDMYASDQCAERAEQILEGISSDLPVEPKSCLDIGCGQGGMLAAIKKKFPGVRPYGIEPSEEGVTFCQRKHGLSVLQGEWNESIANSLPQTVSLVTSIHVMEHVEDPCKAISLAASKLEPEDGRLYVEVPDLGCNWGKQFFHIAHIHYFDVTTLARLCRRSGLEPVAVKKGLADLWPWGSGIVCKKANHQSSAGEVKATKRELKRSRNRIQSHASNMLKSDFQNGLIARSKKKLLGLVRFLLNR